MVRDCCCRERKEEPYKVGERNQEKEARTKVVEVAKSKQIPPHPILCRIQYSGTESINTDN